MAYLTVGGPHPIAAHLVPLARGPAQGLDVDNALASTESYWRAWAARCTYEGRWRDDPGAPGVRAQGDDLRTNQQQSVITPTSSLPESIGGIRNWDYRFCWLRDASLTLDAFLISRCPRRGAGVPRLAAARRSGRSRRPADRVQHLRSAAAHRVRAQLVTWVEGLEAGACRQRSLRAVPAGRLRRHGVSPRNGWE